MPKIGNYKSASRELCPRCNNKRRVSKTWAEKIENEHGFMILEHSQIICTNDKCQEEFDKTVLAEVQKREKIKQDKLEGAARRLAAKTA